MTFSTRLPKAAMFAFAAPILAVTATAQDECATASPITVDTATFFDTTTATASAPDFSCAASGGTPTSPDVWLEFTATGTYTALVTTCGTIDYDSKIEIYSGACGALVSEACNDDTAGCAGFSTEVNFNAVSGTQYFIRIGGWQTGDVGSGTVLVTGPPPPPDECAIAAPITPEVPLAFDTTVATASTPDFSCAAGGGTLSSPDLWFEFTASADYTALVTTCGTINYDSKIEVYSGTCGSLVTEACNDDTVGCAGFSTEVNFNAVTGTQYYIRVGGYTGTDVGSGTILVTGPPPAIANDECSGAIALSMSGAVEFWDTTNATANLANPDFTCSTAGDPVDVWYTVTPLLDGSITVTTAGSGIDTVLEAYEGGCTMLVSVACDDDISFPSMPESEISFAGIGGTTYYIRTAVWNSGTGAGQISATFADSYPNDDCSGAIAVGLGSTLYTNVGAGDSLVDMSCAVGSSVGSTNDVWFTFTAGSNCTIVVDTLGSDFDTTIAAYSGDCTMLTEVACDDDFFGSPGFLSQMTFDAIAGTTYYIQAGSWNGEQGNGSLNIAIDNSPGIADLVCLGVPNSTGEAGTLRAEGSLVAADNNLTFEARCLPANQTALLVNSSTAVTTVNNPGGSTGNLCIASFSMGRHPLANTGAAGSVSYPIDTTSIPGPASFSTAMVGDTYYFQFWYRDGMSDSNFTSAVSVTFQ